MDIMTPEGFAALMEVIAVNFVLSGDNAIVIGLAAAGLPERMRQRAILVGILAATVMRMGFAVVATQLLEIRGIVLLGGLLLLWVCWKMWRELQGGHDAELIGQAEGASGTDLDHDGTVGVHVPEKTMREAVIQIIIADVSMSLDNVLAVAGAAHSHVSVMVIGLALSIVLMAVASSLIARLISRYRWIGYGGLAVLIFIAGKMIVEGGMQLAGGAH